MRLSFELLGLGIVGLLVAGCGSGDGLGVGVNTDDGGVDGGGGQDSSVIWDAGNSQFDQTAPPPDLDATLDVSFPDAFYGPDSSQGQDAGQGPDGGCKPDGITCNGDVANTCKNGNLTSVDCALSGKICADGYGCVVCDPGSGTCNGSAGTVCNSDGTGYVTNDCDPLMGLSCQSGVCVGACATVGHSYIGCDYYAVTMINNWLDQTTFTFSVSIANTSPNTASVTITGPANYSSTTTIAAGAIKEVTLPWVSSLSCGTGPCNGGQPNAPTTEKVTGGAYRIRSTEPVTVYQFNARDYAKGGSYSYTNDASLLLPVNAMTGNYYAASYPSFYTLPGIVTIVGTEANTQVTVSPSTTIVSGGGLAANGGTVTLGRGDVLQITNPTPGTGSYGSDMSGTGISASAPVEVFGGQACVYIPASQGYCDHMEEVMFPKETLREDYLVVPPKVTGYTPKHFVRIVGTVNGTTLTYDPTPTVTSGTASTSLNAGQVAVFETATPFHVTANANHPFEVASYMEGSSNFGDGVLSGDPAMSMEVATAQFRTSYAFTAPNNYQINWVTVLAPTGKAVTIDGNNVTGWTTIGNSGYRFAYYQICNGNCGNSSSNHSASGTAGFGIQVYGYGSYTSYMYPGGLDLNR